LGLAGQQKSPINFINDRIMNYQQLLDESMMEFVKKVLTKVQQEGLHGEHHFYISFITDYPLVQLSDKIRQRYPKEITIVLQNQFEDLVVKSDGFSVKLRFDGISEVVRVPFRAISNFSDPSVNFSVQFKHQSFLEPQKKILETQSKTESKVHLADNVISLERFRNKHKPS
jgi:uncharacterized protein